jgi:hypothetical protein
VSEGREVRKTFVARADLLERLLNLAKSKGVTLYTFVNQVLQVVLEVEGRGMDLRRVFEEWKEWVRVRSYGLALVPAALWSEVVEEAYGWAGERLVEVSREAGEWIAKRITSSGEPEPLKELEHIVKLLASNPPELLFEVSTQGVRVRVANPRLSKAHAEVLAAIIEGALSSLGYEGVVKEVGPGLIRIEAWRGGDAKGAQG